MRNAGVVLNVTDWNQKTKSTATRWECGQVVATDLRPEGRLYRELREHLGSILCWTYMYTICSNDQISKNFITIDQCQTRMRWIAHRHPTPQVNLHRASRSILRGGDTPQAIVKVNSMTQLPRLDIPSISYPAVLQCHQLTYE
jgi:hypothetical protein